MWLLIDDLRSLDVEQVDLIARTPEVAKMCIEGFVDELECVIFDHDLGDVKIETGYDIMVWMFGRGIFPPRIQLITANPVGRKNMAEALKHNGYDMMADGVDFLKL